MDRIMFFNSISGIVYPDMLVSFYDQIIALRDITMYGYESVAVSDSTSTSITFHLVFSDAGYTQTALNIINSRPVIYGRIININIDSLTDKELIITMKK